MIDMLKLKNAIIKSEGIIGVSYVVDKKIIKELDWDDYDVIVIGHTEVTYNDGNVIKINGNVVDEISNKLK